MSNFKALFRHRSELANILPCYVLLIRVLDGSCIFSHSLSKLANVPRGKKVGKPYSLKSGGLVSDVFVKWWWCCFEVLGVCSGNRPSCVVVVGRRPSRRSVVRRLSSSVAVRRPSSSLKGAPGITCGLVLRLKWYWNVHLLADSHIDTIFQFMVHLTSIHQSSFA